MHRMHYVFALSVAQVQKAFTTYGWLGWVRITTDVGQIQRRRHHMTARGLSLSSYIKVLITKFIWA